MQTDAQSNRHCGRKTKTHTKKESGKQTKKDENRDMQTDTHSHRHGGRETKDKKREVRHKHIKTEPCKQTLSHTGAAQESDIVLTKTQNEIYKYTKTGAETCKQTHSHRDTVEERQNTKSDIQTHKDRHRD